MDSTYLNNLHINDHEGYVYLTEDESAWIKIEYLPNELKEYGLKYFNEMFDLKLEDKGKIMNKNNEIQTHRYHTCYLNTPKYDPDVKKNYMFCGLNETEKQLIVPEHFSNFYDYICSTDSKYNQIVANWFVDKNNYIPNHVDGEYNMIDDYKVCSLTLNETADAINKNYRLFTLAKYNKKKTIALYDKITIELKHGMIITIGKSAQKLYKHGIPQMQCDVEKRISLSFRQMAEK